MFNYLIKSRGCPTENRKPKGRCCNSLLSLNLPLNDKENVRGKSLLAVPCGTVTGVKPIA